MTRIIFPWPVMMEVFKECDRYDDEETGGRLIGVYSQENGNLTIRVIGVIGPGPKAKRTRTSFFNDGEYQEGVFRRIENRVRNIQHLGNWHTHHPNGLSTLSVGDVQTYHKNVNSKNHNTDFFYSLLITERNLSTSFFERYLIRHFMFHRDESDFQEIPCGSVEMTSDGPVISEV